MSAEQVRELDLEKIEEVKRLTLLETFLQLSDEVYGYRKREDMWQGIFNSSIEDLTEWIDEIEEDLKEGKLTKKEVIENN